jgi:hypothetical protein
MSNTNSNNLTSTTSAETLISKRISALLPNLAEDLSADAIIHCANGASVRAHSFVIALHSPVMHGSLAACTVIDEETGKRTVTRPPLFEIDVSGSPLPVSADAANLFVRFCYEGSCPPAHSEPVARELHYLSSQLGVTHLQDLVEADILIKYISAKNACSFLSRANGNSGDIELPPGLRINPLLIDGSRAYVLANAAACFQSDGLFDLSEDILVNLLQDDSLSIREEDLFLRCHAWADVRSARYSNGDRAKMRQLRSTLLEAVIPHIRFPVMGLRAFTLLVVPYDVLPANDIESVFTYFAQSLSSTSNVNVSSQTQKAPTRAKTRFLDTPRSKASGSLYSLHSAPSPFILSRDACAIHFSPLSILPGSAPAAKDINSSSNDSSLAVTSQTFVAGSHTISFLLWGVTSVSIGVLVSNDTTAEGDCAEMMTKIASPSSSSFEGFTINASGKLEASVHQSTAQISQLPESPIQDGDSLILTVDCETKHLYLSIRHAQGSSATAQTPTLLASLNGLPGHPLRVAVGAIAKLNPSDMDSIRICA